jgi:hypothetical protein
LWAVRQCPMARPSAIHAQVIVVSARNRAAMTAFLGSKRGRR